VTGAVTFIDFHEEFSIGMGTFADVAHIRLQLTVSVGGDSISTDTMIWLAGDIGPILFVDQTTSEDEELTGGTVCGAPISPTGGATPTPTSTPTPTILPTPGVTPPPPSLTADLNRDGRVDQADLALLLQEWRASAGR
jgi:hypothetical protein